MWGLFGAGLPTTPPGLSGAGLRSAPVGPLLAGPRPAPGRTAVGRGTPDPDRTAVGRGSPDPDPGRTEGLHAVDPSIEGGRPTRVVRLTRFRLVALAVVGLLALVAGISVWRMRSADELPDVGDPFDVSQALRPIAIADHDNAYTAYAEARFDSRVAPEELWDATWKCRIDALTWSKAKPELRAFQQSNRAALEIWRKGSERADALYRQPSEMAFVSLPPHLLHRSLPALGHGRPGRIAARRAGGDGRGMGMVPGDAAIEPAGREAWHIL